MVPHGLCGWCTLSLGGFYSPLIMLHHAVFCITLIFTYQENLLTFMNYSSVMDYSGLGWLLGVMRFTSDIHASSVSLSSSLTSV